MQVTYGWDLGDIMQYYALTGELLIGIDVPMHLLSNGSIGDTLNAVEEINSFYNNIVFSLQKASYASIPRKKHNYQKYWWDEELSLLKQQAIQSFNAWVSLGKPRQGKIFESMRKDKAAYKLALRTKENRVLMIFQTVLTMPSCVKIWIVSGRPGGQSFVASRLLR